MESARQQKRDEGLAEQVTYALLLPAVRLALALGVPLRALAGQLEVAYFHETRRHDLKTGEAAERLGVSLRKVSELSNRLKQTFLAARAEHELPRRIEFLLWAAPESEAHLRQALPDVEPEEIAAAIARLLAEGRIAEVPGRTQRWVARKAERRLVADALLARLDALENLAGNVAHAVFARFFRNDEKAFARTLSFHVRPDDLQELQRLYQAQIWPALRAIDERAKGAPDAEAMDLSLVWAPNDYVRRNEKSSPDEGPAERSAPVARSGLHKGEER